MTNMDETDQLSRLRAEIDRIDDLILDAVEKRLTVTASVKALKNGGAWPLPIRPAREVAILKRLIARKTVPADLVERLWRVILSDSSSRQQKITLHVSRHLNANLAHRLVLRDHFGPLAVEEWRDEGQALLQINDVPTDLCVVEAEQPWAENFIAGHAGKAEVISALPVMAADAAMPRLLVVGHAPQEASGTGETLIISSGKLPRDFLPQALWHGKSGALRLTGLPGFHDLHEAPLVALGRQNSALGLSVAGRYVRLDGGGA